MWISENQNLSTESLWPQPPVENVLLMFKIVLFSGVVVVNAEGIMVKSTLESSLSAQVHFLSNLDMYSSIICFVHLRSNLALLSSLKKNNFLK